MSKCKFCQKVELVWPENYVKGMKPMEEDTHVEHNFERCKSMREGNDYTSQETPFNAQYTKQGWIKRICEHGNKHWFSKKHYTESTVVIECEGCMC